MYEDKEKIKELINNPLFRQANPDLCKQYERILKEDEAEKKVREFLRENRGSSFAEVILKTKVDIRILENLIADGRVDVIITPQDRAEVEKMQKEVLQNLTKLSRDIIGQRQKNDDKKASGMYSKKENLRPKNK